MSFSDQAELNLFVDTSHLKTRIGRVASIGVVGTIILLCQWLGWIPTPVGENTRGKPDEKELEEEVSDSDEVEEASLDRSRGIVHNKGQY